MLSLEEFRDFNEKIEQQIIVLSEPISDAEDIQEEIYSYEDIKPFVSNIKLNWQYLTNKERQQFLEKFVNVIMVDKKEEKVEFKRLSYE